MSHNHSHQEQNSSKNIGTAFFLNLSFAIFEFFAGFYSGSIAISSDALHDFGDSLSLGVSWYFEKISRRKRTKKLSYGYKRFSILGALINSIVLLVGSVIVLYEAIPRLFNPSSVNSKAMILFAIIGITVNGFAVFKLIGSKSVNQKVVALHLLEDVLGWVAVLIGSIIMYFFDFPIIDPILSVLITIFILYNVFKNLKGIVKIILQAVPESININKLEEEISNLEGINSIHDLHIWTMDNDYNILSVHIVTDKEICNNSIYDIKCKVHKLLYEKFKIQHSTIEIEKQDEKCDFLSCEL